MIFSLACLALGQILAKTDAPDGYILQPEDVISISVVGFPAFSGDFLIPPGGVVDLPILGNRKISDLTISELTRQVTQGMRVRLKNPEVIITLRVPRVDRLFVIGDVRTAGITPYRPGMHLAQALSAVGGLNEGLLAGDYHVSVLRGDKRLDYYLPDVLEGKPDSNPELRPNDVITLTANILVPVNVVGEVRTPGLYRLRNEMNSVLAAIAASGGPTDTARISHVNVRHLDGTEETVDLTPELVRGETAKLPKLRNGDLIIVPQSLNRFAVLGAVADPGVFPIPEGRTLMLSDALAISRSSDTTAKSRYPRIGIIRRVAGKDVRYVFNFGKFLVGGDISQNPEIHPFDVIYVPESPRIELTAILAAITTGAIFEEAFKH